MCKNICLVILALGLSSWGCASSRAVRAQTLLEEGRYAEAMGVAEGNWAATRAIALEILEEGLAEPELRSQCTRALTEAGPLGEPLFERLLQSSDPYFSTVGIVGMLRAGLGDREELVGSLEQRTEHDSAAVRALAIAALGAESGHEEIRSRGLSDPSPLVRRAALGAFSHRELSHDEAELLQTVVLRGEEQQGIRARALRALSFSREGEALCGLVEPHLFGSERALALAGVQALAHAQGVECGDQLLRRAMNSDDTLVAVRAAAVVARAGDPVGFERLQRALRGDDSAAARTASIAVIELGAERFSSDLIEIIGDDPEIRLHIYTSFLTQGGSAEARRELRQLLVEPGWIGLQAALALARVDDEQGVARLRGAALDSDVRLRAYAVQSSAWLPRGELVARQGLGDANIEVRVAAASAMLRILSRES